MLKSVILPVAVVVLVFVDTLSVDAQQVYTTVPLVNTRDSFYESIGTDWGFSHRGRNGYMFFNRGGANAGIPAIGGFDPNAAARFGFGSRGRNGSFYFNGWAGQGSNRSITSSAPSLMLQNGTSGFVQDLSVRPFVTGLIPVVGDITTSPVAERLERLRHEAANANPNYNPTDAELLLRPAKKQGSQNVSASSAARSSIRSSAERGDLSVAEIRQRQAATKAIEPSDELNTLIETAQFAEASGRMGAARIRYQQAAAKASGELKKALQAKSDSLRD